MSAVDSSQQLWRAVQLIELKRFAEAQPVLARVLAGDPENAQAQRLLARCLLGLDSPLALETAARAVAAEPTNEHGHRLLSLACAKSGQQQAAVEHARTAVRLGPGIWQAHHVLASSLTKVDPYAALQTAGTGLGLAPSEPSMHLVHGLAAMEAKMPDVARASFLKTLELDPDNASARNNLAVLDLRQNKFGKAVTGFGSALSADPRFDLARRNIDAVAVAMLVKLRAVVVLSALVAMRFARDSSDGTAAGIVLLAGWGLLTLWGVRRVPKRYRGYVLGVVRRRARAAIAAGAVACSVVGIVIGPLTGLASVTVGLDLCLLAGLTAWLDIFRGPRFRRRRP